MPKRPGQRLVGIRSKVSLETQFRWVQNRTSESKTKWASCAIKDAEGGVTEPSYTVTNAGTSFAQVVPIKPVFSKSASFNKPCSAKE